MEFEKPLSDHLVSAWFQLENSTQLANLAQIDVSTVQFSGEKFSIQKPETTGWLLIEKYPTSFTVRKRFYRDIDFTISKGEKIAI